jgi:hypothetical protein
MPIYGYWAISPQKLRDKGTMQLVIKRTRKQLYLAWQMFQYNLKIIFANKFIYFLMGAVVFFLMITIIDLLDPESYFNEGNVYTLLLFPGLLIIFYPSAFGIQNDLDSRMIEVLFGIPDYRYKVWLVRLVIIFIVVYIFMVLLGIISTLTLTPIPVFEFSLQLMFPIFFLGSLGFMLSTVIRNGSGTAATMVIIGLIFWIMGGILEENEWNIFLNPYAFPDFLNEAMWQEMLFYNRLYLLIGTILCILAGLFKLQVREKFI